MDVDTVIAQNIFISSCILRSKLVITYRNNAIKFNNLTIILNKKYAIQKIKHKLRYGNMNVIQVRVKDQFDKTYLAKARLNEQLKSTSGADLSLYQRVQEIQVEDEILLPSTELLFESQETNRIYRIIGQ